MSRAQIKTILTNPITVLIGGFGLLLCTQIIAGFFVSILGVESKLLVAGVITAISLCVLAAVGATLLKLTASSWRALGISMPKKGWMKQVVIYTALYYIISYVLQLIISLVVPQFDPMQTQDVGISSYTVGMFAQSAVVLVVLTPLLEEFFFRGLLFKGLRRSVGFVVAAGTSSLLFALAHGQWNVALDTFVLGLFLSKIVEDSESLLPAIVMHAGKNAIALGLLFTLSYL